LKEKILMAQNDVFRVTMVQSVNGERVANVFYYRQESGNSGFDPKFDLGTGLEATINPIMVANLGVGWKCLCYEIALMGVTGQQFFRVVSAETPGAVGSNTLNAATVAVAAVFTATGGRSGTGRAYISGLDQDYEERNNLNATGLAAIDAINDALILPLVSNGVTFQQGRYKATPSPVFDPWVLADVRVPLAKLKSRRQSTKC
jgi:hypothetical protein